jgi:REP element-mobilizing transposase RayT
MSQVIHRHKRGYLPHYDSGVLTQFVTFRLADSLPTDILKSLQLKFRRKQITEVEYYRAIEHALDVGTGENFLARPEIALLVSRAVVHFNGERYELIAWVVMPNHVHLLFRVLGRYTLSQVVHSIKSFTSSQANGLLGRNGRFWSADYFDRFIRDRVHLSRVKQYIENNPVKAGLCDRPDEWPWSNKGYKF